MMKKLAICLLIVVSLVTSSCDRFSGKLSLGKTPLLIDADMDTDDMLAIMYLLNSKKVDIKAISISTLGSEEPEKRIVDTSNFLAMVKYPKIPISSFSNKGFCNKVKYVYYWSPTMFNTLGIPFPENPVKPLDISGADLIVKTLLAAREPMDILCLGPLNNVAQAIVEHPKITEKIKRLYMMGGAINVEGNWSNKQQPLPHSEYNIAEDPCAASIVFGSGIPITLVPLDVTNQVPLNFQVIDKYGHPPDSITSALAFEIFNKEIKTDQDDTSYYLWDPCAAAAIIHPDLFEFQKMSIKIETKLGPNFGRTMPSPEGHQIFVCTKVDADAFYKSYFNTLD